MDSITLISIKQSIGSNCFIIPKLRLILYYSFILKNIKNYSIRETPNEMIDTIIGTKFSIKFFLLLKNS